MKNPDQMDNRIVFLPSQKRRFNWAGYLLGFALGGLFDGIVLHQILQWQHFLGGITRAPFDDLRMQIAADGLFQAAMYIVATLGLRKLLQARHVLIGRAAGRLLVAYALIGFGAWHVADAILANWVFDLHRVRIDAASPLFWDLLWLVLFGALFIAAGIVLRQHCDPAATDHERPRGPRSTLAPR